MDWEGDKLDLERHWMDFSGHLAAAYLFLSKMYFTIHTTFLPLYTHMLGICPTSTH